MIAALVSWIPTDISIFDPGVESIDISGVFLTDLTLSDPYDPTWSDQEISGLRRYLIISFNEFVRCTPIEDNTDFLISFHFSPIEDKDHKVNRGTLTAEWDFSDTVFIVRPQDGPDSPKNFHIGKVQRANIWLYATITTKGPFVKAGTYEKTDCANFSKSLSIFGPQYYPPPYPNRIYMAPLTYLPSGTAYLFDPNDIGHPTDSTEGIEIIPNDWLDS